MAEIRITEQEVSGERVYHWQILNDDGTEFNHSAYHTDRAACEAEAAERLAYYREQDWVA